MRINAHSQGPSVGIPIAWDVKKPVKSTTFACHYGEWIGDGGEVFMERDFRVIEEIKTKLSGIAPAGGE